MSIELPLEQMTLADKLEVMEVLWADLSRRADELPSPDWQLEELARRKANLLSNPATGLSWDEVKQRIRNRYER